MSHYRLPFLDSFDHYATAHNTRKWTFGCGSIVDGRHGNGCNGTAQTAFAIDYGGMAAGCAYKSNAYGNSPICLGSGYAPSLRMVELNHLGDGRLQVALKHGSLMSLRMYSAASDFVMHLNNFYYLELKVSIGAVKGNGKYDVTYEARANEESILSGGFQDVEWTWGTMNVLTLLAPGGGNVAVFDDVYATEGVLLGDIRIGVIRPNGAGTYSDWTPQPGGDHYDQVNDINPDDASTYLQAGTAGLKETHQYEDISINGAIKCIQTVVCLKKSDAGEAQTKSLLRSGGGDEDQGIVFYPSEQSYLYDRKGYQLNPWTGLAWTQDEINAIQFGLSREV